MAKREAIDQMDKIQRPTGRPMAHVINSRRTKVTEHYIAEGHRCKTASGQEGRNLISGGKIDRARAAAVAERVFWTCEEDCR